MSLFSLPLICNLFCLLFYSSVCNVGLLFLGFWSWLFQKPGSWLFLLGLAALPDSCCKISYNLTCFFPAYWNRKQSFSSASFLLSFFFFCFVFIVLCFCGSSCSYCGLSPWICCSADVCRFCLVWAGFFFFLQPQVHVVAESSLLRFLAQCISCILAIFQLQCMFLFAMWVLFSLPVYLCLYRNDERTFSCKLPWCLRTAPSMLLCPRQPSLPI